jgi:hypothetical protein
VPADHEQAANALLATWDLAGPAYYRLGKDDKAVVTGLNGRFENGRVQILGDGADVLLVTMGSLTTEVVAVMADDDYVTVMVPRKYPDPRTPGKDYFTSWFDTWRFVNGKADEHWDPATISAPPAR